MTASLCRDHDLRLAPPEVAAIAAHTTVYEDAVRSGKYGDQWAVYGPGQALVSLPLYVLGRLASQGQPAVARRATTIRWVCGLNPIVTALTAALVTWWVGLLLGSGETRRLTAAAAAGLGFALCTLAWPYAKTYLSEPLSALCYLGACYLVWASGPRRNGTWLALAAGVVLAFGLLVRPHNIVLVPILLLWLVLGRPWRQTVNQAVALTLPVFVVALWWLWYNQQRFGAPLDFGYLADIQSDFHALNLPRGIVGQLVSPGRGLVFYAPPVLLGCWGWRVLRQRDTRLAWLLLAAAVWQLVFYSLRGTWWANWCWGPRYLVPVVPLLCVLAGCAPWAEQTRLKEFGTVLLLLGLVNAWAGLVVYNGLYQDWCYKLPDGLSKLLWSPAYSPLVGHWRFAFQGHVDLPLWHIAQQFGVGTALPLLLIRLAPALVGLWLLRLPEPACD